MKTPSRTAIQDRANKPMAPQITVFKEGQTYRQNIYHKALWFVLISLPTTVVLYGEKNITIMLVVKEFTHIMTKTQNTFQAENLRTLQIIFVVCSRAMWSYFHVYHLLLLYTIHNTAMGLKYLKRS